MSVCAIVLAATLPVFDFATNSIAQRIAGADPAVSLSRFVDYPRCFAQSDELRVMSDELNKDNNSSLIIHHSSLNQRFWLKDVDFSCASPWNDSCGSQRAGTLISKRHIIFANHFPLWKGVRILFVDREGEVCPCHVAATKPLKRGDIMLGLLDYEVTPNIRPAKILPDDYAKYIGDGKGLPIVTFNQREQVFLSRLDGISTNANLRLVSNVTATNQPWKALGGKIVGGDSGNPAFLLIGNEPILLYCLFSGGAGLGPSVFHFRKEIQTAMDELCPGYKLESFDFSKALH